MSLNIVAPRVPDEIWETYRPVILEKYGRLSLKEVMEFMKEEHAFIATRRQYVHRLLKVWNVSKYKRTNTGGTLPIESSSAAIDDMDPESAKEPTPPPPEDNTNLLSPVPSTCQPIAPAPQLPELSPPVKPSLLPAEPAVKNRTPLPLHSPKPSITVDIPVPMSTTIGKRSRDEPEDSDSEHVTIANFSCPFRKRNPVRFNVYNNQSCAIQGYPDISQLKRHVKNFHRSKAARGGSRCPRCKEWIATTEEFNAHLTVPVDQICELVTSIPPTDPEDGISAEVEDALNDRRPTDKIATWDKLWQSIFPQDDKIPKPDFEPPLEHFELRDFITSHFPRQVAAKMSNEPGITLSEPELTSKLHNIVGEVLYSFQQNRIQPRQRKLRTRSIGQPSEPIGPSFDKPPPENGDTKMTVAEDVTVR